MANIKDLQDQRATFLTRLYGAVDASTGYYIDGQELANELNMDRETLDKIGSYLSQEGFIQRMGAFGKNMSITHQGIKEAERILEKQGFTSIPNSKVQATSVASEPQQKSGASESSPAGNLDKDAQIKSATLSDSAVEIKDDALDHGIYAAALVDFLTHKDSKPPFALAITGPWGSGKTNLMGWIRDELKRRDYPVTWFSAWRHNQREAIWAAFARQIINDHIDTWRDLRLRWRRFWRQTSITGMIAFFGFIAVSAVLLSAGPNWLPDVFASHPVLSWLGSVLLAAVPFAKYWKPLLFSPLRRMATTTRGPDYTSVLGFQAAFEEDFRELVRLAGSEEKPLVIFIDDLDRAPPPIPAEIVEAINHLIGVKHCIFVIGLDLDMVSASIEAKYAKVIECLERSGISGTGFNGRRFLEKMIQITFSIPAISDEKYTTFLRRLLGDPDAPAHVNLKPAEKDIRLMVQPVDTLSSVVKNPRAEKFVETFSESPEVRKAVYSASDYLQRNPRAIKRFINNFRLACFIANRNNLFTGGNMDLAHLAAVVAAATEYPRIYRVWQRNDYQLRLKQLIDAWSVDDYKFKDNEEIKDLQLSGVRYAANIRECLLTLMRINDKQLYTSLSALFDSTPVNEETAAESPAPGKNKK